MPTSLTLRVSLLEGHLGLTGQVWLREKISNVICLSKRPSEKTMSPSWLFQEKQMKEALREAKTKHQALIEEKAIPKTLHVFLPTLVFDRRRVPSDKPRTCCNSS